MGLGLTGRAPGQREGLLTVGWALCLLIGWSVPMRRLMYSRTGRLVVISHLGSQQIRLTIYNPMTQEETIRRQGGLIRMAKLLASRSHRTLATSPARRSRAGSASDDSTAW